MDVDIIALAGFAFTIAVTIGGIILKYVVSNNRSSSRLESKMDSIETRVNDTCDDVGRVNDRMANVEIKVDKVNENLTDVIRDVSILDGRVSTLERDRAYAKGGGDR